MTLTPSPVDNYIMNQYNFGVNIFGNVIEADKTGMKNLVIKIWNIFLSDKQFCGLKFDITI